MAKLTDYDVTVNGFTTSLQLTADDAKRRGLTEKDTTANRSKATRAAAAKAAADEKAKAEAAAAAKAAADAKAAEDAKAGAKSAPAPANKATAAPANK